MINRWIQLMGYVDLNKPYPILNLGDKSHIFERGKFQSKDKIEADFNLAINIAAKNIACYFLEINLYEIDDFSVYFALFYFVLFQWVDNFAYRSLEVGVGNDRPTTRFRTTKQAVSSQFDEFSSFYKLGSFFVISWDSSSQNKLLLFQIQYYVSDFSH